MDSTFSCDDSSWPVVVVQMPARWTSLAELAMAMAEMTRFRQRGPLSFVVDVRGAKRPDAAERAVIAKAIRHAEANSPHPCKRIAVVTTSTLAHGVFLALEWLAPQRCVLRMFGDRASAVAWARQCDGPVVREPAGAVGP